MSEDTKLLLRMLRASEAKAEGLRTSGDSPFRAAAEKAMAEDIARMKVEVFDAVRPMIEAAEK